MSGKLGRALVLVVAGLLAGSSQGCASLWTTALEPTPYGGAREDLKSMEYGWRPGEPLLAALDLLPSVALDTVVLPITIPCSIAGVHADFPVPTH